MKPKIGLVMQSNLRTYLYSEIPCYSVNNDSNRMIHVQRDSYLFAPNLSSLLNET